MCWQHGGPSRTSYPAAFKSRGLYCSWIQIYVAYENLSIRFQVELKEKAVNDRGRSLMDPWTLKTYYHDTCVRIVEACPVERL